MNYKKLLEENGSPLYVYDLNVVAERAKELKEAFAYEPCHFHYAIKANPSPLVVKTILDEGYGIDAVSPGEVALALKLGVKPENILYTENNMTNEEMQSAIDAGVLINCGSLDRLERLGKSGGKKASVRFNPDIGGGETEKVFTAGPLTKFGVYYSMVDEVLRIEKETGIKVIGAHMHIGSGILEADLFVAAMKVILKTAEKLPNLEFIDFGGGLGIPYKPEQSPIDLKKVSDAATKLMTEFSEKYGKKIELHLEPGRFLVGEAGSLYTVVTAVKTNPDGRVFVGCDSGFNHLVRPCMYGSYHKIDNATNPDAPLTEVDVVGNICESGDIFARDRKIPMPKLGDILAIREAGAYGMSMATTYNMRPLPAEVVIKNGEAKLARKAQTIDELINNLFI